MNPDERKVKIAELRAYHAGNIPFGSYFTAKCPHTPEGKDYKHIGLYESEAGKGDDVYLELVTMDYNPLDSSRTIYVWKHNPNYKKDYAVKKEQFLIPVSELKVVSTNVKKTHDPALNLYHSEGTNTETYVTHKFITNDETKIEAIWKNGIPHELIINEKNAEHGYRVNQPIITHILNIFNKEKP